MKLSCGIVMGGKSSRMGENKAFLEINRHSFLNIIANELLCFDELIVSVDCLKKYKHLHYSMVEDEYKNIGAIEGIRRILEVANNEYVFICAVDMPFLKKDFVKYMTCFISSDFDCYVVSDAQKIHPLCAIYSKKILTLVQKMIDNKQYKLMELISNTKTKYIDLNFSCFDKKIIYNINTKQEFKEALKPIIFCISGLKNSGKTSLILKLIHIFKKEFHKIGVIKHDAHDFSIDCENTDTYRFTELGTAKTAIFSDKKYALMCNSSVSIDDIINKMTDMDIIIIEGMKYSLFPKIEIVRKEISNKSICSNNLIAIATDTEIENRDDKIDIVDLNNTEQIANAILKYFHFDF